MNLTQFINQMGGFGALLDTNKVNDIFPYTSTARADLWGLQRLGAAKEYDGRKIRIRAQEPIKGVSLLNSQGSGPNILDKLGWQDKEIGSIRVDEAVQFTGNDIIDIVSALRGEKSEKELNAIATNIITNVSQMPTRRDRLVEKMFWDSALGSVTLAVHNSTAPITYTTGTTQLATPANLWSDTANSDPFVDLIQMHKQMRQDGFVPEVQVMNATTYEWLTRSESVIRALTSEKREEVRQGTVMETIGKVPLVVYEGSYADENGVRQPYLPDGKVVLFARDDNAMYNNMELYATANPDITGELADMDVVYGEFFYVATEGRPKPTAVTYGYSFNGAVGVVNPKSIIYRTVL